MVNIKVLPPEEARRIAAGEVVDRPAALIREFLDNAIDAGASNIDVTIEEGGSKKVEVSDDGAGMNRENLELCYHDHATSKIRGLNDLDTVQTLGFRGEALAAAAAVARLEIITNSDDKEAWCLQTGPGNIVSSKLEQTRRVKGTTIRAHNLFESIPARKRFLKREGSEATLCRQALIDKALAFNTINFRFYQDGKLKDFFPAVQTKKERFASTILQSGEEHFLHEINVSGSETDEKFTATIVIGGPELYRNNRRHLFVFANGRRVQDYSLLHAMEYGVQGWFPNGVHPVGAVFVEIDPSLADFNIHPAKREVRFRDSGAIHSVISAGLKNFFHHLFLANTGRESGEIPLNSREGAEPQTEGSTVRHFKRTPREEEFEFINKKNNYSNNNFASFESSRLREKNTKITSLQHLQEKLSDKSIFAKETPPVYGEARYAGRVFGLFILVEWGDKLYIIDQHAAHERILYNRFLSEPIPKQELLAPIPFDTESEEDDNFLEKKREELSRLGVDIIKDEGGWYIEALPVSWRLGDAATVNEILELRTAKENMTQRWAATLCCHAAIKDGDYPDDETALALAKEALVLSDPHCPHGRPIWTEISKEALFKAVRRS